MPSKQKTNLSKSTRVARALRIARNVESPQETENRLQIQSVYQSTSRANESLIKEQHVYNCRHCVRLI